MNWFITLLLLFQVAGSTGERGIAPSTPLPTITTSSPLPTGTANSVYNNFSMSFSGGTAPGTWAVIAGALPTGLNLSSGGVISGTPTTAQTTTPTIQVTDANSKTNSVQFSITINASGGGGGTDCITNLGYASNRTITTSDTTQAPPNGSLMNVPGASYCLNANITNVNTASTIQADNISLDLNGHTITYATSSADAKPHFGIVGIGCAEADASGNPCGGNFTNPTIYSSQACTLDGNGDPTNGGCTAGFIQGAGAVGISDAVRIGGTANNSTCGGGTFHDFYTTVTHPTSSQNTQKASASIHFRYCAGNLHIYQVQTNNSEAWVINRSNLEGPDIRLENWTSSGVNCEIDHNNFSGAGQGGISPFEQHGCLIHHNLVGTDGHAIQDFSIFGYGTNDVINNNIVNCISCRGAFLSGHNFNPNDQGTGVLFHHNTMTVRMKAQYCNDGGCANSSVWSCETHGSYTIQFDDQILSSSAYNNTVVGIVDNSTDGGGNAASCNIAALRVSALGDDNNTSHDNTFNIKRSSSSVTGKAIGFYTESTPSHAFTSTDDTFNADSYNFFADWQGSLGNQTFIRPIIGQPSGGNPDSGYKTFHFFNGLAGGGSCSGVAPNNYCPVHWFFIDPTFNNAATRDSHDMGTYGGSKGPAEYWIQFTYKPTINCANGSIGCTPGNPVSGVLVVINDVTPTQVFSNTTDASGHLNAGAGVVLSEFRRSNCATENFGNSCSTGQAATKTPKTPHSVTLSKASCTTISNHAVDLTGVTLASSILTETVLISCP